MFKRRRNTKLKTTRFSDSTRRRIAKKMSNKRLISRRLKQITMRFEEAEQTG